MPRQDTQSTVSKLLAYDGKETEQCCWNRSVYEITYNHISKTWLVCIKCLEIECFNSDITKKTRIRT